MKYYIDKTVDIKFSETVTKVKKVLPDFGFGVVTEFDIGKKLKEKLGVEFRQYTVLGACNPKYAYEALLIEPLIGTMLPCNIVIQELDENKTQVAAIDPVASMIAVENEKLKEAADFIKIQLSKIIDSI